MSAVPWRRTVCIQGTDTGEIIPVGEPGLSKGMRYERPVLVQHYPLSGRHEEEPDGPWWSHPILEYQ